MPFEPYAETKYTPNPDGAVSGMTSLSSAMGILTDTPGALLDVSYNQDTAAVVRKLTQRITELENRAVSFSDQTA